MYSRAYSFLHDREDALDATQDVFMRVLHAIGRFNAGSPLWPWLRKITTTTCLNRLRSKAIRPETLAWDAAWEENEPMSRDPGPEASALLAWDRALLSRALAELPPLNRAVVVLRHEEDLSYEQIADLTGLPLGTVKTYLFRGRQRLRESLKNEVGA